MTKDIRIAVELWAGRFEFARRIPRGLNDQHACLAVLQQA